MARTRPLTLTAKKIAAVDANPARRDQVMERCRRELSTNFNWPARDILAMHGADLGLTGDEMGQFLDLRHVGEAGC